MDIFISTRNPKNFQVHRNHRQSNEIIFESTKILSKRPPQNFFGFFSGGEIKNILYTKIQGKSSFFYFFLGLIFRKYYSIIIVTGGGALWAIKSSVTNCIEGPALSAFIF